MASRACRPFSLTVPPEILRFGDEGADVVFRGVGVERDFRSFEHAQKFVFAPEQALELTVERRIAGAALEDAVELRAQEACLLRSGRACRPSSADRTTRSSAWRP